jgi:Nif-specific regulatory protein
MKPQTSIDPVGTIEAVNRSLSSDDDVRTNVRSALETLAARIGVGYAFFAIPDDEGNSMRLAETFGLNLSDFRRLESNLDSQSLRGVFQSGAAARGDAASFGLSNESAVLVLVPAIAGKRISGIVGIGVNASKDLDAIEKIAQLGASMIAQTMRIEHAIRGEREKLREENLHLKQELKEKYDFTNIIGNSNPMKLVYEQISQVAKSNATVLLRGESGTGKEMIANAIHYNSLRSKKPFIKINCAAVPETLIESELFGHEKGAFTGADRQKKGRFELADGGTLFLDEIGDLPVQTQIKLLRVLQEREFERIGGTETIKANIRLITATNKNLEEAIANGEFREDLYYRLNVFSIFLPPLRERKSDILLLAEHFLEKYEIEHNKRIRRISTPAIDMLMSYHFPGNVRELENAIERAVLVCDTNVIHGHHLPPTLQTAEVSGTVTDLTLGSAVAAFERDMIQDALKSTKGNVAQAARNLDTTQRILGYKIKRYGIDTMRFRK